MIQLRREWGRFSNFSFRTPQRRISAYPARPSGEDVTPDRNFSPLCFAVPRLQSASEHGLVSEEAVFNARLLSVARLLLPLSSPDLANPSQEPCHAAPMGRPLAPPTPQSDEGESQSRRSLYRPR